MKSKSGIFLEYLWLVIATGSLIAGIHQWYHSDIKKSSLFFVMVLISILMYTFRRNLRKKHRKEE